MQYSQAVAVESGRGTQWSAQDNSDAALVDAIAAGDKHALQVLYGRHHVKVYRFAPGRRGLLPGPWPGVRSRKISRPLVRS